MQKTSISSGQKLAPNFEIKEKMNRGYFIVLNVPRRGRRGTAYVTIVMSRCKYIVWRTAFLTGDRIIDFHPELINKTIP